MSWLATAQSYMGGIGHSPIVTKTRTGTGNKYKVATCQGKVGGKQNFLQVREL